ncbi:hypothetical protein C5167_028030 [Papaver somniferum]|nr:hypothetical protein C5167_028030 [Papaver somniferum]
MLSPVHPEGYTYSQGILRQHGRIYIGSSGNARQNILAAAHSSAIGGHSGVQACYQRDDLRRVDTIFLVLKVFFESRCQEFFSEIGSLKRYSVHCSIFLLFDCSNNCCRTNGSAEVVFNRKADG